MKIISLDSAHFYQSNSMNRGVQTFTSFISDETQFIFLKEHLSRLLKGADFLFPEAMWPGHQNEIEAFLKTEFVPSHYFRLSIANGDLVFMKKPHTPKEAVVSLANAQSLKVATPVPAFVKSANYLVAELEIKSAQNKKFSDVVFFDQEGRVTEASTSNIFMVTADEKIVTPKTSSMILEGVTRKKLINYLKASGFSVEEKDIFKSELESSLEIWLTNAIQGMRVVDHYEGKKAPLKNHIYNKICHEFGRFGEKYNRE
ncbi:MAG: aminotransferase class IV [Bdellovibrionales bacterium]|nr:aminotransferase class IV [Bdellovibrionales bacterium]